jgi:hypothetical protein
MLLIGFTMYGMKTLNYSESFLLEFSLMIL